ncbi:MAG: hypothetical protein OEZ65_06205 [Gemmatimonadota bacterium]|nr:hypothetical protein [Gemmatimonadota bacterium]MDH5759163.1 hypothetical protein [Gemmatimonadota bacterium]
MQSEHLGNVHPGWIVGGWLVAVAVTSGAYLALVGIGAVSAGGSGVLSLALATAVGFFAGGAFVGARWCDAPLLHGGGITFFSVMVWFAGSVALPGRVRLLEGPSSTVLGLVLVQLGASMAGGWVGRRLTLSGGLPDAEA